MKIILFTDCLGAGGAQRQLVGLADMLRQKCHEVTVVTYIDQDFYKSFLDTKKIRNILLKKAAIHKYRIPIVYKFLKSEKPDVVIAYQETPSLIVCLCRLFGLRFKLIVSERNTTQKTKLIDRIRFLLYLKADAIVPNSYSQTQFLYNRFRWTRKKLRTIVNFVDLDTYNIVPHNRHKVPKIVVVASVWQPKNTIGLLQACKILNSRNVEFTLDWYGLVDNYSDYTDMCFKYIHDHNLSNVSLFPKTKNIVEKYHDSDFFCLPSFYEGTPNVICEAISCGKPVICSDVCDNSKYVVDGYNGYLFDPNDINSIANRIEEAICCPEIDYNQMCLNSREIAERSFSKQRFIQEYEQIIEKL